MVETAPPAFWKFSQTLPSERANKLLSWRSFDEITSHFKSCQIAPMWWEPAIAPRLRDIGCHRASFVLTVPPDVYDAFFNSPVGYRGQFARSERHGEAANRHLIESLFIRLLRIAAESPTPSAQFVSTSLKATQAKIWIDENEVEDQDAPLIDFPLWEAHEPGGVGLRAPRGTKLEVKGGWVDDGGEEVINTQKNHRSANINRTGDSQ
jgi:hypothetical protein